MATKNTYIWIIAILAATNISMGVSFWFHKHQEKAVVEKQNSVEMPSEQRTRFFREELNLTPDQVDKFRSLNRSYNRSARKISTQLESSRIEMLNEMALANPSQTNLDSIAQEIGTLHTQLKILTGSYYLGMKNECDSVQQLRLKEIFLSVSQSKEDLSLPQQRGGKRFQGGHSP